MCTFEHLLKSSLRVWGLSEPGKLTSCRCVRSSWKVKWCLVLLYRQLLSILVPKILLWEMRETWHQAVSRSWNTAEEQWGRWEEWVPAWDRGPWDQSKSLAPANVKHPLLQSESSSKQGQEIDRIALGLKFSDAIFLLKKGLIDE